MPRKTTKNSLNHLVSDKGKEIDEIARELLYRISNNELVMTKEKPFDDGEYIFTDFYGEHNDIGITCQQRKKINGINSNYCLIIETTDEPIRFAGQFAAKGWRLCIVQNRDLSNAHKVSKSTINNLKNILGIESTTNAGEQNA